jgi:hypothetical protein
MKDQTDSVKGGEDQVEIQRADPGARTRALLIVALVTVLGGAFAFALQFNEEAINGWLRNYAIGLLEKPEVLFLTAFVLMLPLVGFAVYIYYLATQVVKHQRAPFPGQKVIKDTPVVTGDKAVKQGQAMRALAIAMGLIGLLLPWSLALLIMMMRGPA